MSDQPLASPSVPPNEPPEDPSADRSTGSVDGLRVAHRLLSTVTVLAVVGTVLGLALVQRVGVTYQDGLEVARDGSRVAALAVTEATDTVDEVAELAAAVADLLEQAQTVLDTTADSIDGIGTALGGNVAEGLEGTAEIANGLAGFIETIERFIPGNSDSLAESLRKVSDGLEPAPDQLRELAGQLSTTAAELRATSVLLGPVGDQLDTLSADIGSSQETLAEVDRLARDVESRSAAALERSDSDLWLLRLLVVVLGVGVAAACWAASRAVRAMQRTDPLTSSVAA